MSLRPFFAVVYLTLCALALLFVWFEQWDALAQLFISTCTFICGWFLGRLYRRMKDRGSPG